MKNIVIQNIRNINKLEFELPVPGLHIITGKNGTGKTTLFTCISRICNNNAYRIGFPSSPGNTFDVFNGSINYSVNADTICYTRRVSGEWRPNKHSNLLQDFNYPHIINITTKNDRVFSQDLVNPRRRNAPDTWLNDKLNSVFGTTNFLSMVPITTGDLRRGRGGPAEQRRRNLAYAIPLGNGRFYTEQNFSFGEIVLLNLLSDVKNATNGSIILIDELELALHPSAQIRLISCLRELATEKGLTILISTHSASIIKNEKSVILLEQKQDHVEVIYKCPPAKAIGAIGMREDTMPDILILVEDGMAKCLFNALKQKYYALDQEKSYLDIRIIEVGGFSNVINFYVEANNYIFYDNIYVVAFIDKDVETDIISYSEYGNHELIRKYNENAHYLHFLPYTPEVLLVKTLISFKDALIEGLKIVYDNQQLQYNITRNFDFDEYNTPLPRFENQEDYNRGIEIRGAFRSRCKKEAEDISREIADQLNVSIEEVYRFTYKFAIDHIGNSELNIRALLASTMKRNRYDI
jgi:predicted ATPase